MVYWILGIIAWLLIGLLGRIIYKRYIISRLGPSLWDDKTNTLSIIWISCGPIFLLVIVSVLKFADATFMKGCRYEE